MDADTLKELLTGVKDGSIDINSALDKLKHLPFKALKDVKLDLHRDIRDHLGEVIYAENKTLEQLSTICKELKNHGTKKVLFTRVDQEKADVLVKLDTQLQYNETARMVYKSPSENVSENLVLIITGGTSDIPVAEEAACTAEVMGGNVERHFDVGVAGIHRLFSIYERLQEASVVVAIAGMEGALASVVSGLVHVPVIAVPTSVGYGANFGGLAPLLSMLNSCSPGVACVNIDNGFGAGYLACQIAFGRKQV